MSPETQQRLNNWGCLMSLGVIVAGVIAACLGRPVWLLLAVPTILFWIVYASAVEKARRRYELEVFEDAFRDFDGPTPIFKSESSMGWPHYTLTFDTKESFELAEAQGRISAFKATIQELHGHIIRDERFDVDRAVSATYEGHFNFDHLERQFPQLVRPVTTIWSRINYWAGVFMMMGTVLGTIALVVLGREFTNAELGILVWPLSILWLASFFYVVTYLVFTRTGIWVRVLWVIAMSMFALGLTAAIVNRSW